ncbi:hypothetical protein EPN87_00335 [archaeon]|nr:MAG: hypothetical protein EPN87_00335 [archaeon]
MVTTIFGQYIGFWFGTVSAIFFLLIFLTCRILPVKFIKLWGSLWNPVHKWAWILGILSVLTHFTLITLAYVFGVWL